MFLSNRPFEITQSGLVPSLLTYLTKDALEGHEEIKREVRIRTFLHVFLGCPRAVDSEELPDAEAAAKFQVRSGNSQPRKMWLQI